MPSATNVPPMLARVFHILTITAWLGVSGASALAATPEDTVREIGLDLTAATETAGGTQAVAAAVGAVLDEHFNLKAMALAALPDEYRDAAGDDYVRAYRGYLIGAFVRETLGAGSGTLVPVGARPGGDITIVGAQIRDGARIMRMVEFYLVAQGEAYRVNNVAVESVLVTAEQQKDFRPHLISGDLPGLIAFLNGAA